MSSKLPPLADIAGAFADVQRPASVLPAPTDGPSAPVGTPGTPQPFFPNQPGDPAVAERKARDAGAALIVATGARSDVPAPEPRTEYAIPGDSGKLAHERPFVTEGSGAPATVGLSPADIAKLNTGKLLEQSAGKLAQHEQPKHPAFPGVATK